MIYFVFLYEIPLLDELFTVAVITVVPVTTKMLLLLALTLSTQPLLQRRHRKLIH